jgi:hypothetical protein
METNIESETTRRLEDAFEELRNAIFATHRAFVEHDRDHDRMMAGPRGSRRMSEQERREDALESIDEILEWRPLATFPAVQIELLELMVAYWREAEVEVGAPPPDLLQ